MNTEHFNLPFKKGTGVQEEEKSKPDVKGYLAAGIILTGLLFLVICLRYFTEATTNVMAYYLIGISALLEISLICFSMTICNYSYRRNIGKNYYRYRWIMPVLIFFAAWALTQATSIAIFDPYFGSALGDIAFAFQIGIIIGLAGISGGFIIALYQKEIEIWQNKPIQHRTASKLNE